jgi:hypothetical protein
MNTTKEIIYSVSRRIPCVPSGKNGQPYYDEPLYIGVTINESIIIDIIDEQLECCNDSQKDSKIDSFLHGNNNFIALVNCEFFYENYLNPRKCTLIIERSI